MAFDEEKATEFLNSGEKEFDESKAEAFLSETKTEPEENLEKPEDKAWYQDIVDYAGDFTSGANSVMANILGLPADAANYALEKVGVNTRIMGGSEDVREVASKAGITYAKGEEPDSPAWKAGEYTGEGLAFLAPFLKFSRGSLQAAKMGESVLPNASAAKGVAQRMTTPFFTNTKTAMASELAGSVGAGVGAWYGEELYGPTGEMVGGLAGGIAPQPFIHNVNRLAQYGKKTLFPYTRAGSRVKVGERLRSLAETPHTEKTIESTQKDVLSPDIPPAKLSGDRHLIALQNTVLKDDPELSHKFLMDEQKVNELARRELESIGSHVPIEETQAHVAGRVQHIKDLINARVDKALQASKNVLDDMLPKQKRAAVNTVVKNQIDDALKQMRKVENEAWSKVDQSVQAPTANTRNKLTEIFTGRAEAADPDEIPDFITKYFGNWKSGQLKGGKFEAQVPARELHAIRSRLGNAAAQEKAKDAVNWNKVRILNELQDALLDDMSQSPASKQLTEALAISRELNQKFRGGIMNTILGHERTGGGVAPEISIDQIKGGPKAAVHAKKVLEASPDSYSDLENLVRMNIAESGLVNKDGRLNISAAKKYLLKNQELMEVFPDTRKALDNAIGQEQKAQWLTQRGKDHIRSLEQSVAAKVGKSQPGRVLTTILNSPNPDKQMSTIMKNTTNKGREGMKNEVVDFLLGKSRTGEFDEMDMPILSGRKLANVWKEHKNVLGKALTDGEQGRIEKIIATLKANETPGKLPDVGDPIPPGNRVVHMILGTMAARAGAQLGHGTSGASLKTASMMTRFVDEIVTKFDLADSTALLKDAIQDPELFKTLMMEYNKPQQAKIVANRLQGWMAAHMIESLEEKPSEVQEALQ